jgi:hypothetical protein
MVKMATIGREELSSIRFPICLVAESRKPWYECFFELVHNAICPELLVKVTPVGAIGLQCTTPVMMPQSVDPCSDRIAFKSLSGVWYSFQLSVEGQ